MNNTEITAEEIAEAQAAGYAAHIAHCEVVGLRRLEAEARKLQGKLWEAEAKWQSAYSRISNTPQFADDCKARGIVEAYRFADVLS